MKIFVSLTLLLLVLSGQSYAQWQNMNLPSTVKVNSIAVSNSNIFAATDGEGIFVSTDNGANWDNLNAGLQSKFVHTVFIDGTKIFAGTDKGAFVSTNNGLNWDAVDSGLSGIGVWSFAARNSNTVDSTIFAGTWNGVFVSTDYGNTWKATSLSNTSMPVNSLSIGGNYVFASTLGGGVFYSSGNGFFWQDISIETLSNTLALVPVYSLATIDTTLIAAGGAGVGGYLYYARVDSPAFKSTPSASIGNGHILCFAIHDSSIFAANSVGTIFLSNSSNKFTGKYISPTLKNQAIYSFEFNNSYIFAGTGNGVWRLRYPETPTNVENYKEVPAGFALEQNYPNPFNPSTTISYSIPETEHVTLKVYDELGREIKTLVDGNKDAGQYEVQFNGSGMASGIYYYRITAGKFNEVKKLILMK